MITNELISQFLGVNTGLAVVMVMVITSCFLVLVMVMIWKTHVLLVMLYVVVIGGMEFLYLSSVLYKIDQGGYLPLVLGAVLVTIMLVWNDVYRRKYYYELNNKISPLEVREIANNDKLCRIPGLALFYSELVQGIPPIFKHYVENVPALHSVLVFVSIRSLPISKVPVEERFFFRRIEPTELHVFRCVARYGYNDFRKEKEPFERMLVERLMEFIKTDFWIHDDNNKEPANEGGVVAPADGEVIENEDNSVDDQEEKRRDQEVMIGREIAAVEEAGKSGVVHLMGESEVIAGPGAWLGKRILIDYAYSFLKRNLRQNHDKVFDIPHKKMVKVGMTYEL